jgi:replication factor A1
MSNVTRLTPCINDLYNGNSDLLIKPNVQIIDLRAIENSRDKRCRAVLSDGLYFAQAIINKQPDLEKQCVIKILDSVRNDVSNKRMIVVLNYQVVHPPVDKVLGKPQNIENATKQTQQQSLSSDQNQQSNKAAPSRDTNSLPQRGAQSKPSAANGKNAYVARSPANGKKPIASSGGADSISEEHVQPINSLNPYQPNWLIKARVTAKADIKNWDKGEGRSGKLFSVDLIDNEKGEIRAVMFNEAVDTFHDIFEIGRVYLISKGKLKHSNKKYSQLKSDYEITLDTNSIVRLIENDKAIPSGNFTIVPLHELADRPENEIVDVVGVVDTCSECMPFVTKNKKDTHKRSVKLLAPAGNNDITAVELTLWGKIAQDTELNKGDVIVAKGVRKSNFNGVSLNTINTSTISTDADIDEYMALRGWWETNTENGVNVSQKATQLTRPKTNTYAPKETLLGIKEKQIGYTDTAEWAKVRATVSYIRKDNMFYEACKDPNCKGKKLHKDEFGRYTCNTCKKETDECDRRYYLSVIVNDHTGSQWATAFNEVGVELIGKDANELYELQQNNEAEFEAVMWRANFNARSLSLKCQLGQGGEPKPKYTIMNAYPISFAGESRGLLQKIEAYQNI